MDATGSAADATDDPRLASLDERLRTKIKVNPDTLCWEWQASRDSAGYGHVRQGKRVRKAHRVIYEILVGEVLENVQQLDHLCRVPRCVNPGHLEPVTPLTNVRRGLATISAPLPEALIASFLEVLEEAYRRGVLDGIRQTLGAPR